MFSLFFWLYFNPPLSGDLVLLYLKLESDKPNKRLSHTLCQKVPLNTWGWWLSFYIFEIDFGLLFEELIDEALIVYFWAQTSSRKRTTNISFDYPPIRHLYPVPRDERQGTLWADHSYITCQDREAQDKQPCTHIFTPKGNLERLINLFPLRVFFIHIFEVLYWKRLMEAAK